jgi:hypothetical protein
VEKLCHLCYLYICYFAVRFAWFLARSFGLMLLTVSLDRNNGMVVVGMMDDHSN